MTIVKVLTWSIPHPQEVAVYRRIHVGIIRSGHKRLFKGKVVNSLSAECLQLEGLI